MIVEVGKANKKAKYFLCTCFVTLNQPHLHNTTTISISFTHVRITSHSAVTLAMNSPDLLQITKESSRMDQPKQADGVRATSKTRSNRTVIRTGPTSKPPKVPAASRSCANGRSCEGQRHGQPQTVAALSVRPDCIVEIETTSSHIQSP